MGKSGKGKSGKGKNKAGPAGAAQAAELTEDIEKAPEKPLVSYIERLQAAKPCNMLW